ncbi:MAG: hypothetical protein H6839_04460 [Planctomycetes bacterium]|nr:hypothetical protein [Planctomycetota bacterium]
MLLRAWLFGLICATSLAAGDIYVTTTSMTIDVAGAAYISQDSSGRSGLYDPNTLAISDLPGTDGLISLPEAIIAANNTGGADTIHLDASTYTVSAIHNYWYGPNGLPPITSDITIQGNGAVIERDTGAAPFRLFFVMGSFQTGAGGKVAVGAGTLMLRNCTLRNGLARGGDGGQGREVTPGTTLLAGGGGGLGAGGAIFSQGTLTLDGCTLHDNTARGGDGGDVVSGSATAAGGGGGMGGNGAQAGSGSIGGGFYGFGFVGNESGAAGGQSMFGGNGAQAQASTADGGGGGFGPGDNGSGYAGTNGGGYSGAVNANANGGAFGGGGGGSNGSSGGGIGGGGGGAISTSGGGAGGFGGGGGGGFAGDGGYGGFGAGGGGGGLMAGTPSQGASGGWGGGGGGNAVSGGAGGGGGAGMGGALFNHNGSLTLINCTLTQNYAIGGDSTGGESGGGLGGAVFNLNGSVLAVCSTIAGNTRTSGASSLQVSSQSGGGAVYSLGLTGSGVQASASGAVLTLENSILAGSTDGSAATVADVGGGGTMNSDGVSVVQAGWLGTGNPQAVDPQLTALADNDGPTLTMLPAGGSPVINSGNNSAANLPGTDQRGVVRIAGGFVDVGAVETRGNIAPQISSPAPVSLNFGNDYTFGTGEIVISDDAALGEELQLTLYTPHGVFTLSQVAGLTFSVGDGAADANMIFTGTLPAINAALDGMVYSPASGLTGQGIISIGIDDLGHTGVGGAKQNSAYVFMNIVSPPAEIEISHSTFVTPDGGGEIIPLTVGRANAFIWTIKNSGTANLMIGTLTIYGIYNCVVNVTSQPPDTIGPGGTGHFIIEVTPVGVGGYGFEISLTNSDADENPYDISVLGYASAPVFEGRRAKENCSTGENTGALLWILLVGLASLMAGRTISRRLDS